MEDSQISSHAELLIKSGEQEFDLRIHRAISWLEPAEAAMRKDCFDEGFIFYWVAFNAAYARVEAFKMDSMRYERDRFREYFDKILRLDVHGRVYEAIWNRFSENIRRLLNNRYVYGPFWLHSSGEPEYDDWERRFDGSRKRILQALSEMDTGFILNTVFGRLYILRNQLMHGAAKWQSSANREQVIDGARIMESLVPVFIDLMIDSPDEIDWGQLYYPYLKE